MITLQENKIETINDYVDLHYNDIVKDGKIIGRAVGYLVNVDKIKEDRVEYKDVLNVIHLSFWIQYFNTLDLNGNAYVWKEYSLLPEHQNQEIGIEVGPIHHDLFFNLGCRYLLAYPHPLYDDKSLYKDTDKVRKDKETLITYYIEKFTYRGNYVRQENTDIIIKDMEK